MARILLGPVIGLVTRDSARILLEIDTQQTVTMVICDGNNTSHRLYQQLPAEGARVFHFKDLTPEMEYSISIEGAARIDDLNASFRTLPDHPQRLRIAALSCDSLECDTSTDMWKILYERGLTDPYDVILHLGDNVYLDGERIGTKHGREYMNCTGTNREDDYRLSPDLPYENAERLLVDVDRSEWPTHTDAILRLFRERYRCTWGREYKARVLASCCNIMILDDHEIRDDLGDKEPDYDPHSAEYFINNLALQVYHEYQRQLWDSEILSPEYTSGLKNEFFTVRFGPLSVAMVDARTPRAMYKHRRQEGDDSYYGCEQNSACKAMLDPDADTDTRMWLIGCALPLLFFTRRFNKCLIDLIPSNDDLVAFTARKTPDLTYIWDVIRRWKDAKGPAGDIILLGGDVHVGGFTDIHHAPDGGQKKLLCHQVTTSPVRNKHWNLHEYALGMTSLLNGEEKHGDYTYNQYDWVNCCNFLLIEADFSSPMQVHYDLELVLDHGESLKKSSTQEAAWCQYEAHHYCREFFSRFCCLKCFSSEEHHD